MILNKVPYNYIMVYNVVYMYIIIIMVPVQRYNPLHAAIPGSW